MKALCCFAICTTLAAQTPSPLPWILDRIANQAEEFRRLAGGAISEETLVQRTKSPSSVNNEYAVHTVVSAYAYGSLPESPAALHEIRKVISVDGRQVLSAEKARRAMTLGLQSTDDKLKKKLLEDFEHHGLTGAVTDLGQVILLFSARHRKDYRFEISGERLIGADLTVVVKFEQVSGSGSITIFRNNAARKEGLMGELLARRSDGRLLRISMTVTEVMQLGKVEDEMAVDYTESFLGCVLPMSVEHRQYRDNVLFSENVFHYTTFRVVGGIR